MNQSELHAEALAVAQLARQLGLSQSAIAEAICASQSQVSRVLSGHGRRRSKLFDAVCKYVNSLAVVEGGATSIAESPELIAAIESVWDGSPEHARALASVIRSLAVLRPDGRSTIGREELR
jgi:hypothetical protein